MFDSDEMFLTGNMESEIQGALLISLGCQFVFAVYRRLKSESGLGLVCLLKTGL